MTLTKPYEATFQVGDGETKDFPFYFDEVSENFIRVIIKRADGSIYYPTFSVDMELLRVVFGEDEITPTPDDVICIYRDTPAIQDTQFNTLQGYNAKALENILSKIVAMIQEMKANGFSTQILQGEPWSLDLIKPADDGASVQIDYQARVLKKGLYFKMADGNLLASTDGVNFVQMPKSENVAEFRQHADDKGNVHFEYRVGDKWFGLATSADIADTYTKAEVDNKFVVANAQIDANADAIQKTRDDMIQADSEIHQILNNHANELTTLRGNQASLGDQVSGIEEKIPESASGSNPLVTKQQLATKQDQLTAGDNIIISGNVISATGAGGGAGLDMVVVDQLPETGQKGIIYLVKKDGAAPDIHDEYVWIESTQSFELIGTTQVDLSGYAKKTYVDSADQQLKANQDSLYANQVVLSGMLNTKDADGNWTILTTMAQAAIPAINELNEKIESAGDTSLPDQTGNAGKFLMTDGTTASWGASYAKSDYVDWADVTYHKINIGTADAYTGGAGAAYVAIGAKNCGAGCVAILGSAQYSSSVAIGNNSIAEYNSTAIGNFAQAKGGNTTQGTIAIGYGAKTGYAKCAIQLGGNGAFDGYTNSDANTFKVGNANGNFEIMSADGTIPADRIGNLDFGTMD